MRELIVEKVTGIAERVGASEGIEIVDVQYLGGGGSRVLRIFIDKEGGVTHGDCENMSQQVGTILDVEDVIPGERYQLEVSSPGVERKLSKPRDFERSLGKKVKIVVLEPVENSKRWEGTLKAFAEGVATLQVDGDKELRIPVDQIAKANLKFEW